MKPRAFLLIALLLAGVTVVPLCGRLSPIEDELPHATMQVGLAGVSGRVTHEQLVSSLELIDPRHQLDPFIAVTDRSLALYRDARHRTLIAEVALRATPSTVRPSWRTLVIDPGHWGGTWSQNEKRHFTVGAGPPVREGDLTLATALRVRAKLDNVRLTRTQNASSAFPDGIRPEYDKERERRISVGQNYATWLPWPTLVDQVRLWPERRALETSRAFELYTHYDLRMRPTTTEENDIFVSVHYNIASVNQRNGLMAFVHGDALEGELSTSSQRYWAVKRALDGTLPTSIAIATRFAFAMQRRMQLTALVADPYEDKPNRITLDPVAGVHARNLAVLRRAPGVAVLLEGPCMNAAEEYGRFVGERINADGVMVPARAEEYADAIVDVAREFFANPNEPP